MINRWSDRDAAASVRRDAPARDEAVALCLYASRLLGQEPSLVLHGGGNTSVKALRRTVLGTEIPAIFVKASGFDMATLAPEGLPALDLGYLQSLRALDDLDDEAMVNELRTHVFDHRSPTPSIETLVHAFLAPSYISHTHADAILALTNQRGGRDLVREVLGRGGGARLRRARLPAGEGGRSGRRGVPAGPRPGADAPRDRKSVV